MLVHNKIQKKKLIRTIKATQLCIEVSELFRTLHQAGCANKKDVGKKRSFQATIIMPMPNRLWPKRSIFPNPLPFPFQPKIYGQLKSLNYVLSHFGCP